MKFSPINIARYLGEDIPNQVASNIQNAVIPYAEKVRNVVSPYLTNLSEPAFPGKVNRETTIEDSAGKLLAHAGKELMRTPVRDLNPQRVKYLKRLALHKELAKCQGQPYSSNAKAAMGLEFYDAAGRVLNKVGSSDLANSEGMQDLKKVAAAYHDLSRTEIPKYLMNTKFGRKVSSWLQKNRL